MVIDDIDDLIADGVDGLQADTKVGAAVDGLQVGAAVWLIGKHLTIF